jgi:hypothetical protein
LISLWLVFIFLFCAGFVLKLRVFQRDFFFSKICYKYECLVYKFVFDNVLISLWLYIIVPVFNIFFFGVLPIFYFGLLVGFALLSLDAF